MNDSTDRPYKIAISFAEEDRVIASGIATALALYGVSYYYYPERQAEMNGKDLNESLAEVYEHKSDFALAIVSDHYVRKDFTTLEFKAIQRRLKHSKDYLILVKVGDVVLNKLPGLNENVAYFPWRNEFRPLVEGVIKERLKLEPPVELKSNLKSLEIKNIGTIYANTVNI